MKKHEKNSKEEINNQEQQPPVSSESKTEEQAPEQKINVESIQAKISELEQSVTSYKDQLLRKAAEFENYKKRIENDFAALVRFSNEDLITQLLPILDDFARSLKAGKEKPEFESFYKGIELIYNKFLKMLELQGVKEVETVGNPFDVYYHDALMEIARDDVPHHTVVEEVEKGYTLHGKVIRHAKVILAATLHPVEQPSAQTASGNNPALRDGSDVQQPTDGKPTTE